MKKLFFIWLFLVIVLTSIPGNQVIQPPMELTSFLFHFFFYATLMLFFILGYKMHPVKALLIIFLIALFDEAHQAFIPGRHPDVLDLVMDIAGGGFTICLNL